jgi:hypothetical protein
VQLTAGGDDLLTPFVDQFNAAETNATTLADNFFLAPFVGAQQAIVNQAGYLQDLLNGSSSLNDVLTEIQNHAQTVLSSLTLAALTPPAAR